MSLVVLLVTSLLAGSLPGQKESPEPPVPLVSERGAATSSSDGILRIRKSAGWVRTRQLVSDFILTVDVNLETLDTDASIGIRTLHTQDEWPRRGHRIALSARLPAGVLQSRPVSVPRGTVADPRALAPGVWHSVRITARGAGVTVEIGGIRIGTYQIDVTAGAIALAVTSGAAGFRRITISEISDADTPLMADLAKRPGFVAVNVLKEVKPRYTVGAMSRKSRGVVMFLVTVRRDGTVGAMRIKQFLDPELEHEALGALRQWRFSAALLDGQPVETRVEVEHTFTLK
jgi:TonB family protein